MVGNLEKKRKTDEALSEGRRWVLPGKLVVALRNAAYLISPVTSHAKRGNLFLDSALEQQSERKLTQNKLLKIQQKLDKK